VLFTDAVTYCAESKAILIDSFQIAYHRANHSVTFSFSLASVESNLNVSANIYLNVYGIQAVNQTLDLCSYFAGVICPLPQVNFTGYGTYPIPLKYTSKLPSIAWHVPNIEAYARVELLRQGSNEIAACLQATLSNGWSTRQPVVMWVSGIFTLLALLVALFHTILANSPSPAQYRWFDILYLFQSAGATGLMHLNYPSVYSAFTQNFHWALGLLSSSGEQSSIDKLRMKTGGHLTSEAYSDVQYIDRQLSPYNTFVVDINDAFQSTSSLKSFIAENSFKPREIIPSLDSRAMIPSTIDQNATTDLDTGIPVYVNTLNIPSANAFDTAFFVFLSLCAIFIATHALLFLIVFLVERFRPKTTWAVRLRNMWWDFCFGNTLRLCLLAFLPIWIFGFLQFKTGDSGLSIFLAVLAILLTLVPLTITVYLSFLRDRRPSSTAPDISALYTNYKWFHSAGVLYRPYRQTYHFFWFAPLVLAMIVRAAFTALGPTSAWVQVIGNLVVEAVVFVSLVVCRPHKDKKGDWIVSFLSACRLAVAGLMVAFIPSIKVAAIPRTVIGFIMIILFGVPTVILFLGLIWNAGYGYLWRRRTRRIEDGLEVDRFVASDNSSRQAIRP
ncbi:hypothetical protein TREMEDRAFT_21025, partial [Tremella mesenterica DSM 1558]|uniref:uncharacterized protein n=1 Tax=Tremella mesenterica (strain ATCC 24925 / CBS 8224 / DSM 1558 / NBRC 9311 / NRRL Y-6157 / RJB 2259-6 / UBC 559-6) TaxID=578456 RepID=UPI0003F49A52